MKTLLCREIHPSVKIIDATKGICDYIASDETLDYYSEVIRVGGWKFTNFQKNAPFVDSHDYSTIEKLLGRVIDYKIADGALVERVQWAKDIPDSLASLGWKLVEGGFLKAVSVGFYATKIATRFDADKAGWLAQLKELGLHEEDGIRAVYVEQEQIELSACIIGANPNALAKSVRSLAAAHKAGALSEEDLEKLSRHYANAKTVPSATSPADVERTRRRARLALMMEINAALS